MNEYIPFFGAVGFGAIIGWYIYYVNRFRKADIQLSDVTTVVVALGGSSVTALFGDAKSVIFGGYGIGLFAGFFGYFFLLVLLVKLSNGEFTASWFLDGRRKNPADGFSIPGEPVVQHPMDAMDPPESGASDVAAATLQHLDVSNQLVARALDRLSEDPVDKSAATVIATCEAKWDANKGDCSAFVVAVANALGVSGLAAPADAIDTTIQAGGSWRVLSDASEAKAAADAGHLVIASLKGSDHNPARAHGHVVVVVSGPLAQGKYPTAYWGSLGGTPYKKTTVNFAWRPADRDRIHYAAHELA